MLNQIRDKFEFIAVLNDRHQTTVPFFTGRMFEIFIINFVVVCAV